MEIFGNYSFGKPKIYRGKTCAWKNVHSLASFSGNTYEYNYAGVRIKNDKWRNN